MGAAERRVKDQAMAADLVKRGIYHGKRLTSTSCPPVPNLWQVGSAAYNRSRINRRPLVTTRNTDGLKIYTVVNPPKIDADEFARNGEV